ncbi:MAG: glycosyltransferase family 2 protein [Hyphomonadaceae bacterium]
MADVAAGIVAFRPDPTLLLPLVRALMAEVSPAIVFVNGALDAAIENDLREAGADLIRAPYNLGVAEGFNVCALAAILAGKRRVLLLDQDSQIPEGLAARLSGAMDALAAQGRAPAVIGPSIVSPRDDAANFKPPRYFPRASAAQVGDCQAVQYVISSGSLIDLDAFRRVGRFRSDFFIDAIDTEWCFRAWSKGASCWVDRGVEMEHRIGRGIVKKRGFGPAIPRQAEFRLYAYVRNQAHSLTLSHVPALWKARIGAHIARAVLVYWIEHRFSLRFLAAMGQAWSRGRRGQLGPPPGAEETAVL